MASRQLSAKKPKDLGHTLRTLLSYLGRHKLLFLAVAVLVALSALANLLGTYMIRPVVNSLAAGSLNTLVLGVAVTAAIYGAGVLSALGYTQIMVKAAQKVLYDIRRDLFAHIQTLPLRFFDTQRHGDVMSYFTNDVDTISEALNNSFAMLIQSTIQVVGTFTMLFLLNWQLTLVVAVFYVLMFLYVRFSGRRSKAYYKKQQDCLGELDGYIEEMMARAEGGQGVQPRRGKPAGVPGEERGPAESGHRRAELCGHHDSGGGQHLLRQLRPCGGAGRHYGAEGHDRRGQPGQLSGLCPAGGHAHQPDDPAEQLPAGRAGRSGAGL